MQHQGDDRRRWAVDVSAWVVGSAAWRRALSQLPAVEQQQVERFMFAKDQKLALGSRLLQRALIKELFGVEWSSVEIVRTPENKPFWRRSGMVERPQRTWNYNVSHHGTVVAIACHPSLLVGIDVMRVTDRPRGTTSIEDFFAAFVGHFTETEWAFIRESNDVDEQYRRFYRLWSLKESYIKAIGIGLGFSLQRAEFSRVDGDDERWWRIHLDGVLADSWTFESKLLDAEHVVSVAHGPIGDIWTSNKRREDGEDASSIFPASVAESFGSEDQCDACGDGGDYEWRLLSLDELIAYSS